VWGFFFAIESDRSVNYSLRTEPGTLSSGHQLASCLQY
jgi:hypothetical protein